MKGKKKGKFHKLILEEKMLMDQKCQTVTYQCYLRPSKRGH